MGVDVLPPLPKDAGDRNRTSPFAFTGNRFEFRAVGSNQSIAGPLVAMNTIIAESLDYCATQLEEATEGDPAKLNGAVQSLLTEIINECSSDHLQRRRLLRRVARRSGQARIAESEDDRRCAARFAVAGSRRTVREIRRALRTRTGQPLRNLSGAVCLTVNVEANLTISMAKTLIFPAAIRYQNELASTCANLKLVGYDFDTDTLDNVTALVKGLQDSIATLEHAISDESATTPADEARHRCDVVLPSMLEVRKYVDELECVVADDLWPLPTYQEMLFIK